MLGLVVLGSRTWIWTMAAPALAASRQELAICSGVTGTAGLRPGVSAEPVTAQEIITFLAIFHPFGPVCAVNLATRKLLQFRPRAEDYKHCLVRWLATGRKTG